MKRKLRIFPILIALLFFVITCSAQDKDQNPSASGDRMSVIISAVSVAVALLAALLSYLYNRATLTESRRAERRKVIEKTLNEFYGPLLSYLNITKALHILFVDGKPEDFRTLTYLMDRNQEYKTESGKQRVVLSASDEKLLSEIIETEKRSKI